MSNFEIIRGNKLIMQFKTKRPEVWSTEYFDYAALTCGFNTDFNKIIPIVANINELNKNRDNNAYNLEDMAFWLMRGDIEMVWTEVVKYISRHYKRDPECIPEPKKEKLTKREDWVLRYLEDVYHAAHAINGGWVSATEVGHAYRYAVLGLEQSSNSSIGSKICMSLTKKGFAEKNEKRQYRWLKNEIRK